MNGVYEKTAILYYLRPVKKIGQWNRKKNCMPAHLSSQQLQDGLYVFKNRLQTIFCNHANWVNQKTNTETFNNITKKIENKILFSVKKTKRITLQI